MKLNCFVLIILITNFNSTAQTISMLGGISLPLGVYSSKDFTQKDAGYANPGYLVSIIFEDNRKSKIINPYLQYTFNQNSVDEEAVEKYYKFLDPKLSHVQVYRPYSQNILMVGSRINYFGTNYDLFLKGGIGMAWANSVAFNIYADTLRLNKYIGSSVSALALSLGIGCNIYINPTLSILMGYDYYFANTNYGYEKITDPNGNIILTGSAKLEMPVSLSTYHIGLRFQLQRILSKNKKIMN